MDDVLSEINFIIIITNTSAQLLTTFDNRLKWDLQCIRNVSSAKTNSEAFALLTLIAPCFSCCFISLVSKSVLIFSLICWYLISQTDKNNLQRTVDISSKVTGFKQSSLTSLYQKQVLRKANTIISDNANILYNEYVLLSSSRSLKPSHPKQIGSVDHSIQCLHDISTTSTSDVSVRDSYNTG